MRSHRRWMDWEQFKCYFSSQVCFQLSANLSVCGGSQCWYVGMVCSTSTPVVCRVWIHFQIRLSTSTSKVVANGYIRIVVSSFSFVKPVWWSVRFRQLTIFFVSCGEMEIVGEDVKGPCIWYVILFLSVQSSPEIAGHREWRHIWLLYWHLHQP